jgi:spore coat protein U-like protein
MNVFLKTCLLVIAGVFLLSGCCRAATCSISNVDVAFGAIEPLQNNLRNTMSTLTVTCTGNIGEIVNYSIALATSGPRKMLGANGDVAFELYVDSSRSQVWGDGTSGTAIIAGSITLDFSSASQNYTVYAKLPSGYSRARAGIYNADLVLTLSY